jgi:hypothetical protein
MGEKVRGGDAVEGAGASPMGKRGDFWGAPGSRRKNLCMTMTRGVSEGMKRIPGRDDAEGLRG